MVLQVTDHLLQNTFFERVEHEDDEVPVGERIFGGVREDGLDVVAAAVPPLERSARKSFKDFQRTRRRGPA
jgi:hypothetical protein